MTNKYKALIIDDDILNLEILKKSLTREGYEVIEATSAEKALKILEQDSKFHIILLDRMMPEMNGIEFLKILKLNKSLKEIPVIIQSALREIGEVMEGYEEECHFYLTKPFNTGILLDMVKKVLDKSYQIKISTPYS
jgi:CheY-like chemotaxis protein